MVDAPVPPPGQQWGPPPGPPWGPPGGPQWNQYGAYAGEKPNNYLVWAILSTILCCNPFGVVSIVFANKVNSRWMAGDVAGAREASNNARTWAIVSAVTGLVLSVLLIATGALGS